MTISFAPYKSFMGDRETDSPPATSVDIFGEYVFEWDSVVQSLFSSTASATFGVTKQSTPTAFQVTFRKEASEAGGCTGEAYDGVDPASGAYSFGYRCLWVDITPFTA